VTAAVRAAPQEGRCERLCVLALPADVGVADFCAFVGGYLPRVREMRLVRREDGRSLCLVLLRFDSLASTDAFFADFNNKPVRTRGARSRPRPSTRALRRADRARGPSFPRWSRTSSADCSL
jgi:hypothetical protein